MDFLTAGLLFIGAAWAQTNGQYVTVATRESDCGKGDTPSSEYYIYDVTSGDCQNIGAEGQQCRYYFDGGLENIPCVGDNPDGYAAGTLLIDDYGNDIECEVYHDADCARGRERAFECSNSPGAQFIAPHDGEPKFQSFSCYPRAASA